MESDPRPPLMRSARASCRSMLAGLALALLAAGLPGTAGAQRRVELAIAATTDVHGRLRGWDYYANTADPARSLAGAATIVDSIRREHPNGTVLVDAGDLLQGNPLTFVAARVKRQPVHPVIASMNVMRYDAAVLGNHEFNYGVPLLREAMAQAGFPFLAANVREATGKPFAAPYTIIERAGVRIGIIGATTPGIMVWDRDNVRAARLTVTDIVPAVRQAVSDARRGGAHVIVVLLHSGLAEPASCDTVATGLPSENVAMRVPREIDGIDAVIFGHSHKEVVDSTVNGALLVQPRNWAASVGVASLVVERRSGRWAVVSRRGRSVRVAGHAESPAVLAAHATSHRNAIEWSTAPIGTSARNWRADSARVADVPIIDFINETMRRETGADLAATAAFSLDAALDSGALTVAAISRLYPYDNTLRSVKVSGVALRAFLEHSSRYYRSLDANGRVPANGIVDPSVPGYNFDILSGAEYTLDLSKPVGSRVTRLLVKGRAVQATDTFTLALNNYRQGGGGGFSMLAGAPLVYDRDTDIRQLLIDEVKRAGAVDLLKYATQNWRLEPSIAAAAAYAEQTRGQSAEAAGRAPAAPPPSGTSSSVRAAAGPVRGATIRVIAISDFHAALVARQEPNGRRLGGAVALSAAIAKAQRECTGQCSSIVVDAGDLFTGSPASDWDAGRPTAAIMNRLGVVAGALGNHEFDFGQDTLRARLRDLRHSVLGVNVRGRDGLRPAWIRADTVVTRGAMRIGIVGAAGTHTATSTKRRNVADLRFLPPAPLISERVRALRAAGANVVIALIHDGARCERDRPSSCAGSGIEIARALTDRPDLFVMGHSHVNIDLRIDGMPVVEATSSGRGIVIVDIPAGGGAARSEIRDVVADSVALTDAGVDSIVRRAIARVRSRLDRPVATIAVPLVRQGSQYGLGNLIADAARTVGNSDFAVWNNSGIRAGLNAGPLLYGGVHEVSPFGNSLVRARLRGRDLRKTAEAWVKGGRIDAHISGLTVEFDSARADGARVTRLLTTGGAPIVDSRIYTLVMSDYMIEDADGFRPPNLIATEYLTVRDIDSLARHLQRLPQPVRAPTEPRIRLVEPPAVR